MVHSQCYNIYESPQKSECSRLWLVRVNFEKFLNFHSMSVASLDWLHTVLRSRENRCLRDQNIVSCFANISSNDLLVEKDFSLIHATRSACSLAPKVPSIFFRSISLAVLAVNIIAQYKWDYFQTYSASFSIQSTEEFEIDMIHSMV